MRATASGRRPNIHSCIIMQRALAWRLHIYSRMPIRADISAAIPLAVFCAMRLSLSRRMPAAVSCARSAVLSCAGSVEMVAAIFCAVSAAMVAVVAASMFRARFRRPGRCRPQARPRTRLPTGPYIYTAGLCIGHTLERSVLFSLLRSLRSVASLACSALLRLVRSLLARSVAVLAFGDRPS